MKTGTLVNSRPGPKQADAAPMRWRCPRCPLSHALGRGTGMKGSEKGRDIHILTKGVSSGKVWTVISGGAAFGDEPHGTQVIAEIPPVMLGAGSLLWRPPHELQMYFMAAKNLPPSGLLMD